MSTRGERENFFFYGKRSFPALPGPLSPFQEKRDTFLWHPSLSSFKKNGILFTRESAHDILSDWIMGKHHAYLCPQICDNIAIV